MEEIGDQQNPKKPWKPKQKNSSENEANLIRHTPRIRCLQLLTQKSKLDFVPWAPTPFILWVGSGRVFLKHKKRSPNCPGSYKVCCFLVTEAKSKGGMMKGVGGPLLCIGDLLSDVGESDASSPPQQHEPSVSTTISSSTQSLDLTKFFQVFLISQSHCHWFLFCESS